MKSARHVFIGMALVAGVTVGTLRAGDFASEVKKAAKSVADGSKKAGKEIARESKKIGHEVAETSKDVGKETAKGAKTAWFKTRDWTTENSKKVADATVRWWDDVIRSKEEERDRLQEENQRLKQ